MTIPSLLFDDYTRSLPPTFVEAMEQIGALPKPIDPKTYVSYRTLPWLKPRTK